MLPPKVVCEFTASDISWSPDGRFALLTRTDPKLTPDFVRKSILQPGSPPQAETSMMLVDVAKGTSQAIWDSKVAETSINEIAWISNSATVLFSVAGLKKDPQTGEDVSYMRLFSLATATGKVQQVFEGANGESIFLNVSPNSPRGLVKIFKYDPERKALNFRMVEWTDGRFGRSCQLTKEFLWCAINWTTDGSRPIFSKTVFDDQKKPHQEDYVLDFATGKTQKVVGIATYVAQVVTEGILTVEQGSMAVKTGDKTVAVDVAWLKSNVESKQQRALIAADATASISPKEDAVLTFQGGIVTLRQLVHIPKDAFEKALEVAERMKVMNQAKQAALGVIMFATDNDDQYPSCNGDWASQITPYVKDNSILNGFTYTFKGGNASDIESPAETEIGYSQGVGGRAVAYADGHVKWIPDP